MKIKEKLMAPRLHRPGMPMHGAVLNFYILAIEVEMTAPESVALLIVCATGELSTGNTDGLI